jgi:hypothetical protein
MQAIRVGVREFCEQITRFLESETPIVITRRGGTIGVYTPTRRKPVISPDMTELRAAADRLAAALSDVDEEEIVAEFKSMVSRRPSPTSNTECDDADGVACHLKNV